MVSCIVLGVAALVFTISQADFSELWPNYVIFALATLIFASRVHVQIPGVKSHISVSDTFIFIAILVYGGNAGIFLAGLDTTFSSVKISKTRITYAFNV